MHLKKLLSCERLNIENKSSTLIIIVNSRSYQRVTMTNRKERFYQVFQTVQSAFANLTSK